MGWFKKLSPVPQKWYIVEQWKFYGESLRGITYFSEEKATAAAREFMANFHTPALVLSEAEKDQWVLDKASKVLEEA